ncbi:hypothetical protein V6615_03390 [Oscillospiraceae bacterium PP1C4]
MKKVLSVLLAGAMATSMSMVAFAANPAQSGVVYNNSGEKNGDVFASDASLARGYMNDIRIDGVVPNAELYIPIGAAMESIITDDAITGGSTDPLASNYYNKDAATMQGLYNTAAANETTANKNAAFASITSSALLGGWGDVTTGHGTDPVAKFYYAAKTGVNELTEIDNFAAEPTPIGDYNYFNAAAKSTYDTNLATEQANDTTNIFTAIAAGNEVTGADAWKDVNVKSYYKGSTFTDFIYSAGTSSATYKVSVDSLTNGDYFKFDVDKNDGSKYVNKIEVVADKKLGSLDRTAYLKIKLNDSTTTSELKSTGTISFKAKKASTDAKVTGETWVSGKTFNIDYTLWINNDRATNDSNPGAGDRVFFDPDDNETNSLVWGDDRAALKFDANDDASKFYARLSTKSDSEIYATYGDPQNADLYFYDFVGNPTIPSTSRATLTLGIPWDEDDDYVPNVSDVFIYEKDADGVLTDVTDKFTYSEDATDIEGWSIKTRTLGTYIISDTELDLAAAETEETSSDATASTTDGGKEIPNTGSSDMVNVAVVAAVISLAAAGAVAFKKSSK